MLTIDTISNKDFKVWALKGAMCVVPDCYNMWIPVSKELEPDECPDCRH